MKNCAILSLVFGLCTMMVWAGTIRTVETPVCRIDTRIGILKEVDGTTTIRLSTRWNDAEAGMLTVDGVEAMRLGAGTEVDHILGHLTPGEYTCVWIAGGATNCVTFCVHGGTLVQPPEGMGLQAVVTDVVRLDTQIGPYKIVHVSDRDLATVVCRLSTRWNEVSEEGVLTVNGTEVARLGPQSEADYVLADLVPGEYLCTWVAGTVVYVATFCVQGNGDVVCEDYTRTTPIPVPYVWLDRYVAAFGEGDYERAGHAVGRNGRPLWKCYVAGLDPTDMSSDLVAGITITSDGNPMVSWKPDLSTATPPRIYTILGKARLDDPDWTPLTDFNRSTLRFFKVRVELTK